MIQKIAFEKMMALNARKVVSVIKIMDLNAKMLNEKTIVVLVFEIDDSGIYTTITLMN